MLTTLLLVIYISLTFFELTQLSAWKALNREPGWGRTSTATGFLPTSIFMQLSQVLTLPYGKTWGRPLLALGALRDHAAACSYPPVGPCIFLAISALVRLVL